MERWKVLDEHPVYESKPWLVVREQKVELPNGKIIENYLLTDVPEVAMIFAVTADKHVLMVEQYKHGLRQTALDLPAGYIDPGEEPFAAARRELEEETGHVGGMWKRLGSFFYDENRHPSQFHYYLAENVQPEGKQAFDETEDIRLHRVPLSQVRHFAREGRIRGVHSMAGIYRALDELDYPG